MNNTVKTVLITAGGVIAIAASVVDTRNILTVTAALGGVISGAAVGVAQNSKNFKKREEAARVASAFRVLYEKNKGVVLPEEVSFHGEVDRDRAVAFLDALAATQNGTILPTDKTVIYNFPHSDNVLDTLTKNSQAWVEARTQPLLEENQTLKQQLAFMQQQMAAMQNQIGILNSAATAQQQPTPTVAPPTKAAEKTQDPWKGLL